MALGTENPNHPEDDANQLREVAKYLDLLDGWLQDVVPRLLKRTDPEGAALAEKYFSADTMQRSLRRIAARLDAIDDLEKVK